MRRSLSGLMAMAAVAGCATNTIYANFETLLKGWVGHSEDELVKVWGPPSSVYQSASTRYLTYTKSKACGVSEPYSCVCNTHFEFASGRISSWRWDGDGCPPSALDQETLLAPAGKS